MEALRQGDALEQACAFSGDDGLNDEVEFVDQAEFDQLRGERDATDQNFLARLLLQFEDFFAKIRTNDFCFWIGGDQRARKNDSGDGVECAGEVVL